ncbi:hypothetical protein Tco_1380762, partial [Tanacetum coccineum]
IMEELESDSIPKRVWLADSGNSKSEFHFFMYHAVHCSSEVGVKFRHNLVRDILVDICSKVGIMVRKEAPMGFLSGDGKDLRPADLLLFN